MKTPYSFCVLRYVHDPVTQEFINIGVAVYSPEHGFLRAICATHYARITRMFARIDGNRFRELMRYLQDKLNELGSQKLLLSLDRAAPIDQLLARVLPPDDSSIQFSPASVGLSRDLDRTIEELFERYVNLYTPGSDTTRRNDEDVWRGVYREPLRLHGVSAHLAPKRIVAPNYEYEFQHAWKNRVWHVYEPVSFDMADGGSIVEKANRWLGRAVSLNDSTERFKMHLLLGEPKDENLRSVFTKAENILHKIPGKPELIREHEAGAFAAEVAREVLEHETAGR